MARENPIHNGRLETDLDANNHTIKNLPADFSPLSPATADTLGGVKVGSGLSVAPDGTLSANAPAHDDTKADSAAIAPEFDESSTYSAGEIVMHDGMLYKCIGDIKQAGPWTGDANWAQMDMHEALTGDLEVNSLLSTGDISVGSNATIVGDLAVSGNASAEGTLTIGDGLYAAGDAAIGGDTTVTGDIEGDNIGATSNLTVGGDATITGDLSATGIATSSDVSVGGSLSVTGGSIDAVDVRVSDYLQVGGSIYLNSYGNEILVGNTTIVEGEIRVSGGNYSFDGSGGSVAVLAQVGVKAFDTSTAYAVGDHVIYATTAGNETTYSLYRCTTAHSAGAWDATHFTKIADLNTAAPASGGTSLITNGQVYDALAGKVDKAQVAPEYSASSAYAVGDRVFHDGVLYVCNTAISSPGEAWTAAHWTAQTVSAALALKQGVLGYTAENAANKVTSLSAQSTHAQYPSAKCVYDIVGNIESALNTINNGAS